jgi:hypothetical protein
MSRVFKRRKKERSSWVAAASHQMIQHTDAQNVGGDTHLHFRSMTKRSINANVLLKTFGRLG